MKNVATCAKKLSTPRSDNTSEKQKKIKQRSPSIVKHRSPLHCYFSHAYLSILSPVLQNIFLTEIISLYLMVI